MTRSVMALAGAAALAVISTAAFAQSAPDGMAAPRINVHNHYTKSGDGYTAMATDDQYQAPFASARRTAPVASATESAVQSDPWFYAKSEGNQP